MEAYQIFSRREVSLRHHFSLSITEIATKGHSDAFQTGSLSVTPLIKSQLMHVTPYRIKKKPNHFKALFYTEAPLKVQEVCKMYFWRIWVVLRQTSVRKSTKKNYTSFLRMYLHSSGLEGGKKEFSCQKSFINQKKEEKKKSLPYLKRHFLKFITYSNLLFFLIR